MRRTVDVEAVWLLLSPGEEITTRDRADELGLAVAWDALQRDRRTRQAIWKIRREVEDERRAWEAQRREEELAVHWGNLCKIEYGVTDPPPSSWWYWHGPVVMAVAALVASLTVVVVIAVLLL